MLNQQLSEGFRKVWAHSAVHVPRRLKSAALTPLGRVGARCEKINARFQADRALVACPVLMFFALLIGCTQEAAKSSASSSSSPAVEGSAVQTTPEGSAAPSLFRFESVGPRWCAEGLPSYQNGEMTGHRAILESLGGGVGLADFDRDGWLDAVFPRGGEISPELSVLPGATRIHRGRPDLTAEDVTGVAGFVLTTSYTHGVAIADVDDDGFPDLVITGYQGLQYWKNQGDGTWQESTRSTGLQLDTLWSSSAAWGDLNRDGVLDLYVAHYVDWSVLNHPLCPNTAGERDVCPPRQFNPLPDEVFLGNGDGSFRSGRKELGLREDGKGLGVLIADLDANGLLDVYVANDTVPNFFYRAQPDGTMLENGMFSGTALSDVGTPDGSMGVSFGDFDLDGRPDLWVANYERELFAMYRNLGAGLFQHVSQATGIGALGANYVGFGTVFGDWDLDGDEDLVVSNGHVQMLPSNAPVRQRPLLLGNQAGRRLINVTAGAGEYFDESHIGRGIASGDLDRDGDLDLVSTPTNESVAVLVNTSPRKGRWLQVAMVATKSPRDAIGAQVTLETSSGLRVRQVTSGGSYLSQSSRTLHWGVPEGSTADWMVVRWPSGAEQRFAVPSLETEWLAIEGRSELLAIEP